MSQKTFEGSSKQELERPHTPTYPKRRSILDVLSASVTPYLELIRFSKPAGTIYLFLPCLSAIFIGASMLDHLPAPSEIRSTSILFLLGSILFRGAACTWNDILDQDIDRVVTRTRNRPLARGAVSTRAALIYNGAQFLLGMYLLLWFPTVCIYYLIPAIVLIAIYPLGKRMTDYPQVILSLTWAYGFVIGFPGIGLELFSNNDASKTPLKASACLYVAGMAWTVLYDAVYAHQDIKDDKREGVRSIAIKFESVSRPFFSALASIQIAFLIAAGQVIGAGLFFYVGVIGAAATNAYMIVTVDLENPKSCEWWFHRGAWFLTGGSMLFACFSEYWMKYNAQKLVL
ncbi:Para-hydroxybenzoate--polyprenyltransferase, mitochondrial precursor (PHB:polyprenyltransferase) [Clarireedia jacksonii]